MSSFQFESSSSPKVKKSKKRSKHKSAIDDEAQDTNKLKHRASEPAQGNSDFMSSSLDFQHFLSSSNKINELLKKSRDLDANSKPKESSEDDVEPEVSKKNSLNFPNKIKIKKVETVSDSEAAKEVEEYTSDVKLKHKKRKKSRTESANYDATCSDVSVKNKKKKKDVDVEKESKDYSKTKYNSEDDEELEVSKERSSNLPNKIKIKKLETISDSESGIVIEEQIGEVKHKKSKKTRPESENYTTCSDVSLKKKKKKKEKTLEAHDELDLFKNKRRKSNQINVETLENFHSKNKSLKIVNYENEVLNNLDINSPIFLLELPKNFDPNALIGQSISLNKKKKFKVDNSKYKSTPMELNDESIVVFANQHNSRLQPTHVITIELHSESESIKAFSTSDQVLSKPEVSKPQSLKKRNPVSGLSCTDGQTRLSDVTKEKLEAAVKLYEKSKKHKHKKSSKEAGTSNLESEEIFKYLSQGATDFSSNVNTESLTTKSKRKRKHSNVFSAEEIETVTDHKKKKIKKETVENESSNLLNEEHRKILTNFEDKFVIKKDLNNAFNKSCSVALDDLPHKKEKRHKKDSIAAEFEQETNMILNELLEASNHEPKKHKKKKKTSELELETNRLLNVEMELLNPQKKIKKEIVLDSPSHDKVKKKKKKKHADD